jgi:hypothetical protein
MDHLGLDPLPQYVGRHLLEEVSDRRSPPAMTAFRSHNQRFLLVQRSDQRAVLPVAFRRPDRLQPASSQEFVTSTLSRLPARWHWMP